MPLRRTRDAQRRLLGRGEAAQARLLATARHSRLKGLGLAGLGDAHAGVARLALDHEQGQPLRVRLLPRLLARQRWRRCCSLLRSHMPLWRSCDALRRLLGGGEVAQAHYLASAADPRRIGLGLAGIAEVHAEVACGVVGHEKRQPLRLRLRAPHQRSPTRRDRRQRRPIKMRRGVRRWAGGRTCRLGCGTSIEQQRLQQQTTHYAGFIEGEVHHGGRRGR
eukprot:scaffold43972_cov52-Phaeocystis_antarctica.AAC.3